MSPDVYQISYLKREDLSLISSWNWVNKGQLTFRALAVKGNFTPPTFHTSLKYVWNLKLANKL